MYFATANFEKRDGRLFRYDTKLWFEKPTRGGKGVCVGAVVGLNPGSAEPGAEKGSATVDPTMHAILAAFELAAHNLGAKLPKGAFVRMWNLLYVCDSDEGSAVRTWLEHPEFVAGDFLDPTEKETAPFVWLAWTASTPVGLAVRALSRHEPFCWLGQDRKPHAGKPDLLDVRHPSRKSTAALATVVEPMLREALRPQC